MFAIDLFDFGRGGADFASILNRGRISKSLRTPGLSNSSRESAKAKTLENISPLSHNFQSLRRKA